MIGLSKLNQAKHGSKSMFQTAVRNAGGGNKPKPIDPKTTDYDIIFVGKLKASRVGNIHSLFERSP